VKISVILYVKVINIGTYFLEETKAANLLFGIINISGVSPYLLA